MKREVLLTPENSSEQLLLQQSKLVCYQSSFRVLVEGTDGKLFQPCGVFRCSERQAAEIYLKLEDLKVNPPIEGNKE